MKNKEIGMEKVTPYLLNKFIFFILGLALVLTTGCTSLGHEDRAKPQIEHEIPEIPSKVALTGSGELVIALELMLVSHGINVYASPIQAVQEASSNSLGSRAVARYVINATSTDLDMCIPEGSRQMHFHISVVDIMTNQRLYAMSGDYGCKDTIVKKFEKWFFRMPSK